MSTIVPDRKRARARAFVPRAVRVRNACVRHAARSLGLPVPDSAALSALADGASLRDSIEWWKSQVPDGAAVVPADAAGRPLLKAVWIASITLLGLAFSFGQAQ